MYIKNTKFTEQGKRDLAEKLKTIIKKAVEEICTVTEIAEILTMYEQASYTTTAPSLFLPYSTDDTSTFFFLISHSPKCN